MINIAIEIAKKYHKGHKRNNGDDYFEHHVKQVALLVQILFKNRDEKLVLAAIIVAYLHDVIEDSELRVLAANEIKEAFGLDIFNSVLLVTKGLTVSYEQNGKIVDGFEVNSKSYYDYIAAISLDAVARMVKIADILHNLHDSSSKKSQAKYKIALQILWQEELNTYTKK